MLHGWTPVLTVFVIIVDVIVIVIALVIVLVIGIAISQVLLAMLLSSAGGLILDFAVARYKIENIRF